MRFKRTCKKHIHFSLIYTHVPTYSRKSLALIPNANSSIVTPISFNIFFSSSLTLISIVGASIGSAASSVATYSADATKTLEFVVKTARLLSAGAKPFAHDTNVDATIMPDVESFIAWKMIETTEW